MCMAFLQLCKTLKKENVSKQKEPSMGVNLWRVELGGEKETRFKTLSLKDILSPGVYCIKKNLFKHCKLPKAHFNHPLSYQYLVKSLTGSSIHQDSSNNTVAVTLQDGKDRWGDAEMGACLFRRITRCLPGKAAGGRPREFLRAEDGFKTNSSGMFRGPWNGEQRCWNVQPELSWG